MSQQSIEFKEGLTLTIDCASDLALRGGPEPILWLRGDETTLEEIKGGLRLTSHGDAIVSVPRLTDITLEHVGGDASLSGLAGAVKVGEIAGSLSLVDLAGATEVQAVRGDLAARSLTGPLTIGDVHGDASVRGADALTFTTIHGDFSARQVDGAVNVAQVMGDASLRTVQGDLTLQRVHGDCSLADLRGLNAVAAADDLRLSGGLAVGKHAFSAESNLTVNWPIDAPLRLMAVAPRIVNRLDLLEATADGNNLTGRLGQAEVQVSLRAGQRITLKPEKPEALRGVDFDFETSMSGLGTLISTEINSRLSELTARLGPELSGRAEERAERIAERVQRSVDKAMRKMDLALQRAERQRARHAPPTPPRPTPTPPTPPKADMTKEQFAILKMLQEGKISVEEANKLLDTLN